MFKQNNNNELKMNENSLKKCRTCLRSSTKTFPLTKQATGCNPNSTYGQLLEEYTKLEFTTDYENLMPQNLCLLCCRDLRNSYIFIKQAQCCNNKLINAISKQLHCLQERTIDLPENANDVKKSFEIKVENICQKEPNTKTNNSYKSPSVLLEISRDNEMPEHNDNNGEIEIIDNDPDDLNDFSLVSSPASDNNKTIDDFKITPKDSLESQIDTVCPICKKIISRRDNLIKHLRTQHDIKNPNKLLDKQKTESKEVFSCTLCSCKYSDKYTYLYHLKDKHSIEKGKEKQKQKDTKIIKCRSCDYTARTYAALNYHTRSKHGTENDKFKCKFCAYMCLKKFDLLTHVKNYHKDLIKTLKIEAEHKVDEGVNLNDTTTSTTSYLGPTQEDIYLSENEDSSSDDIPLIEKINKSCLSSNSHNKMEKDNEQFSDEEFIRNILNIKRRQIKSSNKSLARRCDKCGNIYKNYKALYAHQRHVHISEDKYSLCPHCGKKYKRKTDLRIHIEKTHIRKNTTEIAKLPAKVREKRFMCTQCSYVCTTITILNIHINRHHTGEKPYKCDICFKSFIIPYDLKIHRYLHTGERPYKCPICSKGFRDNSHMIKHKRIHSSERPYKCKECSKSFTQSYNLSVHKRTHLKEKKLNCLICGKVFENRSLLNIHRINEDHHDEVN